ncbi:hypothetical protein P692DRAFT_201157282 [Suillus brevipes Sb2]|nr:hypothetical protein P692DRAFT_201157282 [Suillus brevipes Sb2]
MEKRISASAKGLRTVCPRPVFAERYVVLARSRIDIEIHDINFHPQHEVLFLSEIGWSSPGPFFDRFFSVLGSGFGLVPWVSSKDCMPSLPYFCTQR